MAKKKQDPLVDKDGNPTPANPNYFAFKAKQDMQRQSDVNGAPKTMHIPRNTG